MPEVSVVERVGARIGEEREMIAVGGAPNVRRTLPINYS